VLLLLVSSSLQLCLQLANSGLQCCQFLRMYMSGVEQGLVT
jgi:hypothetical protein